MNISYNIERLLNYGLDKGLITRWDVIPTRNALMELLKVEEPYGEEVIEENLDSPTDILEPILDYCAEKGLMEGNTTTYRDLMDTKIMSLLMPRESEVVRNFYDIAKDKSIEDATDYYYALSRNSNYIRTDRVAKNLYWTAPTEYGDLEITVNLSKPEKDPKAIEKAKLLPQSSYPKCLLCVENVGYAGRLNHPARQTHRVIPLTLDYSNWYLQYSPYVYYNEHCIVFNEEHCPMKICDKTFKRLFDFVEQMPHYFLGSNADLPIVGGSILSHDHFQGGRHVFPMEKANVREKFNHPQYEGVKAGIVNWQMSAIRLSSDSQEKLVKLATDILNKWRGYSDEEVDILAYSEKDGEQVPHNTITPIARKNKQGEFEIDLVLRNNRRTEEFPDGIFHPHPHLHHIKKENIGLIEVMGLAVLPGRLKNELDTISKVLTGEYVYNKLPEDLKKPLIIHEPWILDMIKKYGKDLDEQQANNIIRSEVGSIFSQVLECAGVYKNNESGKQGFRRFMEHSGFKSID